jgi:hypothetical protein
VGRFVARIFGTDVGLWMSSWTMLVRPEERVGIMKSSKTRKMKYQNWSERSPSDPVIAPLVRFVIARRRIGSGPLRRTTWMTGGRVPWMKDSSHGGSFPIQ